MPTRGTSCPERFHTVLTAYTVTVKERLELIERWIRYVGPYLEEDCLDVHTSYPLFKHRSHVRTSKMELGVTGPLYLFLLPMWSNNKSIFSALYYDLSPYLVY